MGQFSSSHCSDRTHDRDRGRKRTRAGARARAKLAHEDEHGGCGGHDGRCCRMYMLSAPMSIRLHEHVSMSAHGHVSVSHGHRHMCMYVTWQRAGMHE
jgi:hypothetical protein